MIRIDRSVDIKLIQPMQNLDPALGARMPYPPWPRLSSWKRRPRRCCATLICLSYGLIIGILIWNDDIDIYIYWWSPIVPTVVCLLMYVIYIYICVCVSARSWKTVRGSQIRAFCHRCSRWLDHRANGCLSLFEVSLVGWFCDTCYHIQSYLLVN